MSDDDINGLSLPDLVFAAQQYVPVPGSVVQLVVFEYRFAALIWLHRTLITAIDAAAVELEELQESGRHLVPGWEAESDDVLDESIGILKQDAAPISAGAIIASCCSALESLLTDLLSRPSRSLRGLVVKARALAALWPDRDDAEQLLEHTAWLADRRNSFAHRLVDEGGPWDVNPNATRYTFDREIVEEAFRRVGAIAGILNTGYDDFIRHPDTSTSFPAAPES